MLYAGDVAAAAVLLMMAVMELLAEEAENNCVIGYGQKGEGRGKILADK
jgi:hypothetical protein